MSKGRWVENQSWINVLILKIKQCIDASINIINQTLYLIIIEE